jgi:hypothetical protein
MELSGTLAATTIERTTDMALERCYVCGHGNSPDAPSCLSCGEPFREKAEKARADAARRRRLIIGFGGLVLTLTAAICFGLLFYQEFLRDVRGLGETIRPPQTSRQTPTPTPTPKQTRRR